MAKLLAAAARAERFSASGSFMGCAAVAGADGGTAGVWGCAFCCGPAGGGEAAWGGGGAGAGVCGAAFGAGAGALSAGGSTQLRPGCAAAMGATAISRVRRAVIDVSDRPIFMRFQKPSLEKVTGEKRVKGLWVPKAALRQERPAGGACKNGSVMKRVAA